MKGVNVFVCNLCIVQEDSFSTTLKLYFSGTMRFVNLVTTSLMAVLAAAQVTLPKWYGRTVSVLALVRAEQRTMECSVSTLWVVTKRLEIFQENSRMKYLWETLTAPTAAMSKGPNRREKL